MRLSFLLQYFSNFHTELILSFNMFPLIMGGGCWDGLDTCFHVRIYLLSPLCSFYLLAVLVKYMELYLRSPLAIINCTVLLRVLVL